MTTGTHPARAARAPAGVFPTTHWSVVLAAGHGPPRDAEAALARLCEAYWYPLYAHVRRLGRDAEQARDLTQGFFSVLLERRGFERADSGRGRLRSFLCRSLENFLHHEHEHRQARDRAALG